MFVEGRDAGTYCHVDYAWNKYVVVSNMGKKKRKKRIVIVENRKRRLRKKKNHFMINALECNRKEILRNP